MYRTQPEHCALFKNILLLFFIEKVTKILHYLIKMKLSKKTADFDDLFDVLKDIFYTTQSRKQFDCRSQNKATIHVQSISEIPESYFRVAFVCSWMGLL